MKIEGENAYPLYQVSIRYSQDVIEENRDYAEKYSEIKDGRFDTLNNSHNYMYKEGKDIDEIINTELKEHWPTFIKARERGHVEKGHLPIDNPVLESISAKLLRYETWSLTWFSHWTFDDGRSDEEYLASFARFVSRMEDRDDYCLMGAEDRWRWKGRTDDGKGETDPPCRCKHCKVKGLIKIDH